ncbi:MAG: hybrid sensor histidine kinase/response regulator [Polyangiaceae bacterium]
MTEPLPEIDAGGEILIVDDFVDTLALYEALLAEDGHRVRTAASGVEALRKVEEKEPELVLLDVSMPGMDGLEVLRRLRARRGGGPSVIMLTAARREPSAIESGLREGADAYLTKPIEGRELRARTRAALESFRLKRQLEAQRRDHVAMLVHDLRHPLSSLGLIAEVIDSEDQTAEERRAAVDTIRTLCADMGRLVDGVLAASRLEAGLFSVDPKSITARELIRPSIASFSPVATRRRLSFTTEGDLETSVRADPAKLRQAIDNLLANAIKFTPRGGKVRLRVAHDELGVVFEIADSGAGIAEAERPTIFDRYRQGTSGRTAGGAGLGLAIARGIAEAHGGNIRIVSGDLPGAVFRLFVPA